MITYNNNWYSSLDFVLVSKARQLCLLTFYNSYSCVYTFVGFMDKSEDHLSANDVAPPPLK